MCAVMQSIDIEVLLREALGTVLICSLFVPAGAHAEVQLRGGAAVCGRGGCAALAAACRPRPAADSAPTAAAPLDAESRSRLAWAAVKQLCLRTMLLGDHIVGMLPCAPA